MNWTSQNRKCLEDAREKAEGAGFPGHTQKYTDDNIQSWLFSWVVCPVLQESPRVCKVVDCHKFPFHLPSPFAWNIVQIQLLVLSRLIPLGNRLSLSVRESFIPGLYFKLLQSIYYYHKIRNWILKEARKSWLPTSSVAPVLQSFVLPALQPHKVVMPFLQ